MRILIKRNCEKESNANYGAEKYKNRNKKLIRQVLQILLVRMKNKQIL